MKWTFGVQQKAIAALLLTFVLAVVLFNNRMEKSNIAKLEDTFSSVYHDRLLVENYIYRLSNLIQEKRLFVEQCILNNQRDELSNYFAENSSGVQQLISDYEKTLLTPEEEVLFSDLKNRRETIVALESDLIRGGLALPALKDLDANYEKELSLLSHLSDIQLTEGKHLHENSKKIAMSNASSSQFEMTILIIIGLMIHALIFASRSAISSLKEVPPVMN
ncbi:MAG: MCP four helix bundle domain-containing protein [Crocinitomicaceae bacterium]|nr:MCP four helix bundle domain-containing protein [Crocinitomicaceae bacterium]